MGDWTRVGFPQNSLEFAAALDAVTNMGPRSIVIFAQRPDDHLSVWTVEAHDVARQILGHGPNEEVPQDLADFSNAGVSYIYFSPGAFEAFRYMLPGEWNFEACSRPPRQLIGGLMLGDDRAWEHFQFR